MNYYKRFPPRASPIRSMTLYSERGPRRAEILYTNYDIRPDTAFARFANTYSFYVSRAYTVYCVMTGDSWRRPQTAAQRYGPHTLATRRVSSLVPCAAARLASQCVVAPCWFRSGRLASCVRTLRLSECSEGHRHRLATWGTRHPTAIGMMQLKLTPTPASGLAAGFSACATTERRSEAQAAARGSVNMQLQRH